MGRAFKQFRLEDGTTTTIKEVAERAGITQQAARYRLKHYTSAEFIFLYRESIGRRKSTKPCKEYLLDNGDTTTVNLLMKKCSINEACARSRLHASNKSYRVYAQKNSRPFAPGERAGTAMAKIDNKAKERRVVWGVPIGGTIKEDRHHPSPMDICRNEWHLDRDEYGYMNNGDD